MKALEPLEGRAIAQSLEDELRTTIRYRSGHIISTALRDDPDSAYQARPIREGMNLAHYPVRAFTLLNHEPRAYGALSRYCGTPGCIWHLEENARIPHLEHFRPNERGSAERADRRGSSGGGR